MQLWINVSNNEIFENIEKILYTDDRQIGTWFMKNLPGEVYEDISPQYELQVMSAMQIRKLLGANIFKNIKGFYFGNAQCEFLLPTLNETKKAIDLMIDFDKKYTTKELKRFVLITPFWAHEQIRKRLEENLEYLNDNAHHINKKTKQVEIIVNDFGTLKLLKDYPNLVPVMGRMLVKTLKNPIVDTYGLEQNVHIPGEMMKNQDQNQINETKKVIANNQKKGMSRSALNNKYFLKFLETYGIQRAGLDYMESRPDMYTPDIDIDIYYPYAQVFTGRLCDTAAITNAKKGYYPTDQVCPRTCWKYDLVLKNFETVGYKLLQKGNAGYKSQIELSLPAETVDRYENRLIYTPLI